MIYGEHYFAVGPLQGFNGIEKWKFTDDRYDRARMETNNMFNTEEEALAFKEYMKKYKAQD